MKKSNKLLTLSLGLVLGLGALAACTNTTTPTTSVAAPTTSSQAPTSAPTSEPTSAPTSAPTTSEAPTTSVAPSTSAPTSEAPSTSVSDFVAETARWFIVGGYEGASWDGDAATIPADRTLVLNESKLAEELNIHEATIARINKDQTFRLIKSDNGVASNGWTSAYGYAQVTKVLDAEGNELNLADYIDVDNGYGNDNNIKWVGKDAKIKVSYDSDANEITLQIIDEFSFVAPTSIGAIGDFGTSNWNTEVEFTANNDGTIWTATVTFEAGKEWKVRKNDNWSTSYGFDSLVSYPDGAFSGEGSSNIKAVTGGTYELEFDAVEGKIKAVEAFVMPEVNTTISIATALKICDEVGSKYSDGTWYLEGTVKSIDTAYDPSFGNLTLTLTDGTSDISLYRLAGLDVDQIKVGDTIRVKGKFTTYTSKDGVSTKQMVNGENVVDKTYGAPASSPFVAGFDNELSKDSGGELSASVLKDKFGVDLVDVTSCAKLFAGANGTIKGGSSSAKGTLELAVNTEKYKVTKITVSAKVYGSDGSALTINGTEYTLTDAFVDYVVENADGIETLSIVPVNKKARYYIDSITFEYEEVGATVVPTGATLNANDLTSGDYTTAYVVNDSFSIIGGEGKKVTIDSNSKHYNGVDYTQRIKLGGTGNTSVRCIAITTTGAAKITVLGVASNGDANRAGELAAADGTVIGSFTYAGTVSDGDNNVAAGVFNVTEAGTYYFYSTDSGINVYGVIVE